MTVYHRYDLDDATDTGQFEPMSGINSPEDFDHILTNTRSKSFENEKLARRAFEDGHDLYTFIDPYMESFYGNRILVVSLSEKLAQDEYEARYEKLLQAQQSPDW